MTVEELERRRELAFWSKVQIGDGCWRWLAFRGRDGYARTRWGGGFRLAHRVAYELLVGPIPPALDLDHLCRVRDCVRPDHLEPVTRWENVHRGIGHGTETHCRNGHAFDAVNTYDRPDRPGSRDCRECNRAAARRYAARSRP